MTPRAWAWVGAVCMALLAGAVFSVRFLRKGVQRQPPRPAPTAPLPGAVLRAPEPEPPSGPPPLRGRVQDEDGQAVAGAQVLLATLRHAAPPLEGGEVDAVPVRALLAGLHTGRAVGEADAEARTDAAGRFAITPPGTGPWLAWTEEADGFAAGIFARSGEELVLTLSPRRPVSGVVMSGEEAPVAGAHVHVLSHLPGRAWTVETGEDGSFALQVPAEDFSVLVDAPGYAPRRPGASGEDMHVVLEPAVRCEVRVTREGRPTPARVHVTAQDEAWPDDEREAPGGLLVLDGVSEGTRLSLEAEDASGRSALQVLQATAGGCAAVLPLHPTWPLRVRVRDEAGRPAAGAQVRAADAAGEREATAEADAEGWASLGPLRRGDWELFAERAGARVSVRVRLERAGQEVTLALEAEARRCALSGTVVAPPGQVLPEAFDVEVGEDTGTVALSGRAFSLEVPCGAVKLTASLEGLGVAEWRGTAPASGIVLQPLTPRGLEVWVKADGAPVAQAEVQLERDEAAPAPRTSPGFGRTAADGSVRIEGLAAGRYVLTVSAPGFSRFGPQRLEVQGGTTLATVELQRAPRRQPRRLQDTAGRRPALPRRGR